MPTDQSSKNLPEPKVCKCDGCGLTLYCYPWRKKTMGIPFLKWYCWVCLPTSRK